MPGRLRGHRCSETPLDSSAETGGERAARVGSCRIYLLRSVHRAYLRVDLPQPEDGQRLREAMRHRGGFRLRGDDADYGEKVGPCVRVSRQSLRDRMKSLGCTGGVVFRTTKTPLFGPSRLHRLTGFAVEASLEPLFIQSLHAFG